MSFKSVKLGAVLLFLGVTLLVLPFVGGRRLANLISSGVEGQAEVVRIQTHKNSSDQESYYLRVELPDPAKTRVSLPLLSNKRNALKEGDKTTVVYLPSDPQVAELGNLEDIKKKKKSGGMMFLLGPLLMAGGFYFIKGGVNE